MSRAFTPDEKERIRRALIDRGREIFSTRGIRGTTIRQLCRATGISSGAYYSFFPSKEHLLFDILEEEEEAIRRDFTACLESGVITPESFARWLKEAVSSAKDNPLIRCLLDEEEYQVLARRIPAGRLEAHLSGDIAFARPLIERLQEQGLMARYPPAVITGLLRAVLLLTMHSRDVGEDVHDEVMDLLITFVSRGLIEGGRDGDSG